MKSRYIIGIDEVGRGPLAGPVVVAALLMPKNMRLVNRELGKLKDSKKLTAKKREEWFEFLRQHPKIVYAVARVNSKTIDRINISAAANRAALKAHRNALKKSGILEKAARVFLDGGLYLGSKIAQGNFAQTVIKGDEKITAVKASSIIAKVTRDRYMARLAKKHPQYGFEIHKGYGTRMHREAILAFGPSEVHRLTFLR